MATEPPIASPLTFLHEGGNRVPGAKTVAWLLGALEWLLRATGRELLGALLGEEVHAVTESFRRPVWPVRPGRWPWPLFLVSGLGAAGSAAAGLGRSNTTSAAAASAGATLFSPTHSSPSVHPSCHATLAELEFSSDARPWNHHHDPPPNVRI